MPELTPHEDGTGYVNGKKVGSTIEWYVAIALVRLGWEFDVQVSYFGGRAVSGGMVLDFLVYTLPNPTPVFVQGAYWHSSSRGDVDALQVANLRRYFGGSLRSPITLDEDDLLTPEMAYNTCYKELGKAN